MRPSARFFDGKKIRVLVVEDSAVVREFLEHVIAGDARLELAGSVSSAEEAIASLADLRPDIISMDIRLPGMNGFEATKRIMAERPTPIVVVSASVESEDLRITMNALEAGALTVLEKPAGAASADYIRRLCTQLVIMSEVKVVRRVSAAAVPVKHLAVPAARDFAILGLAASTGGPAALARLLPDLGENFPLPIALVQHIAPGFLDGFAAWLETVGPFRVKIVRARQQAHRGTIYIAARDRHLRVEAHSIAADASAPIGGQRPSATFLFESMARSCGARGLGVVLTGMGDDGARGLLRLRQRGGYSIAEDESTAVVYGMPAEAARLGAASESLPLPSIARRIRDLVLAGQEAEACSRVLRS